jgi:hypothetical protein
MLIKIATGSLSGATITSSSNMITVIVGAIVSLLIGRAIAL